MSHDYQDKPFSESHLESPEYRRRLMRKLNTLIAVLEVACAKVRRSLAGSNPDVERLTRIQKNLTDTLQICNRAKAALERCDKLPEDLQHDLEPTSGGEAFGTDDAPRGGAVEMSSADEMRKFQELGPIDPAEIRSCDLDDLCRKLLGFE